MAQKMIVQLLDDVDGGEADETIKFTFDGTTYEIDLSVGNAETFRAAVRPWMQCSRRVGGRVKPARTVREQSNAAAVRAWARENGFPGLAVRGRIPQHVRAAYEAAGSPR